MHKDGFQLEHWKNKFGEEYTDRNVFSRSELNNLYIEKYDHTRTEMNEEFLEGIDRDSAILEVGTNIANQLLCLKESGFTQLYGIKPQEYAVQKARSRDDTITVVKSSAFDIPFEDGYFDIVLTSGVLIHIAPDKLKKAMTEIYRCSSSYIWGFEYYADDCQEINYRGNENLLWKNDFCGCYQEIFPDLKVIKREKFPYKQDPNMADEMFLLKK